MGWGTRAIAIFVGLASFGVGAWPLGALCFLYLAISLRPRRPKKGEADRERALPLSPRLVVVAVLITISLVAYASGGTVSPVVFAALGFLVLFQPRISPTLTSSVAPVPDSVLLRTKFVPFQWHVLAELKPNAEDFPRSLSAFEGRLLLFLAEGKAYAVETCLASSQNEAENKLTAELARKAQRTGLTARLLPMESSSAAAILSREFSRVRLQRGDLVENIRGFDGVLSLRTAHGRVRGCSAYFSSPNPAPASIPRPVEPPVSEPLLWELLEALAKQTPWPDPDGYSDFLEALHSTRGVPLSERLEKFEGDGPALSVQASGGGSVSLSRAQMRAVVAIYG